MATNFYFNNFATSEEQLLIEDLIIESIRIYGQDMMYLPRNFGNYDALYTADDQSYYNQTYSIEMYIKSVDGFSGDGSFMSNLQELAVVKQHNANITFVVLNNSGYLSIRNTQQKYFENR